MTNYENVYNCVMDGSPINVTSGGKAIGSGGFGCVFRPAIKCKGEKGREKNSISKLLTYDAAEDEMAEINHAKKVVESIPNYDEYFAVTGYRTCTPGRLTAEDYIMFNKECKGPLGITSKEYNYDTEFREQYTRAIIAPDLGLDVSKTLKQLFKSKPKDLKLYLAKFNYKAADFLEFGLSQLIKKGFYHSDVKPQNMMTSFDKNSLEHSFNYIKLIDFGLALPKNATYKHVNTSLLFNFPFTSLFFNYPQEVNLNQMIFLNTKGNLDNKNLKAELKKYNQKIFYELEKGHSNYIKRIGRLAFNMSKDDFKRYLQNIWSEYVLNAIKSSIEPLPKQEFLFSIQKYWESVYRYNLDTWGFLTTFLILAAYANGFGFSEIANTYLNKIIKKFLYNPIYGGKIIPVKQVCETLRQIAASFGSVKPDATKKISKKTVKKIKAELDEVITLKGARCPKGYIRSKTSKNKCVKRTLAVKKLSSKKSNLQALTMLKLSSNKKRCPKGYRRHKTKKNTCVKT